MNNYFKKFKGTSRCLLPFPDIRSLGFVWLGGVLAISVIGYLAYLIEQPLILGSFGATCFIIFIVPDAPFAQPRSVIGGHLVSTLVGLIFFHYVSNEWWSMALALGTALTVMQLLKVPHPPAGSNPLIVFLSAANWDFIITPTLIGAVLLVIVALFYNNLSSERSYPTYWI